MKIGSKINIQELDKLVDEIIDSYTEDDVKSWLFNELGASYIFEYYSQENTIQTLELIQLDNDDFDLTELNYYAENQAS